MIVTAAKLGYAGITLTDHEALCGHVEWLELEKELKEEGTIQKDFVCGLGNEIYLTDTREKSQKYWHFILIAKNTLGHRALRELSSEAWLKSYHDKGMERVPTLKSELEIIVKKYPNTLMATQGCLGSELDGYVLSLIKAEETSDKESIHFIKEQIDSYIQFCLKLFGDDFYLEIAPGTSKDQVLFNHRIKSIASFYNIKIICATDAHFLTVKDREIHKAFLNSKDGEREIDAFYHDAHLMSDDEAYNNLKDIYTIEEWLDICHNSLEIMNKIEGYEIFHDPIIPKVKVAFYPKQEYSLQNYSNLDYLQKSDNFQERYWFNQCYDKLIEIDRFNETYLSRLELEAKIIRHIGEVLGNCLFCYFNTFQHYIDLFWECGSVVGPGRGSAGSFLSNYLLGITQLDPIEWEFPYYRFLNMDRVELPDIDLDLAPSKRSLVLKKIREERGELNVVQVATFGTESSKAAIACACRGYRSQDCPNGIDVDTSQYMSSLVPAERGQTWSITECLEGDESKDRKPIKELITQINQYPGLREIILGVEGLICRRGQHASGVILYNNSPYETAALMRSPNGDITTQFDLHRLEKLGDTKFDFLVTDICDKISVAIDLLMRDNYFSECKTKREVYNKYFHPQTINLENDRLWSALKDGIVQDVFQFNTEIGIQTAKLIQPKNPIEMTAANALLRLVAPEGQERPMDRYIRFKNNLSLWYKEMDEFGLTKEEQKTLEPYYLQDYGVPCNQEKLMAMVMDPNISHFTLAESNWCRKVLGKKLLKKIPEVKEKFIKQCPSKKLGEYCWMTMMLPQMSYSFSMVHSTLYTFIGIQTLLIATNYPSIYWNTACLIVNSQSIEESEDEDESIESNADEVEEDSENDEDDTISKPKKKKQKALNYGKIAAALGKAKANGVIVTPPNINKSSFTFLPDPTNNTIIYGLSGISKINEDIIKQIMSARPFTSFEDFMQRIPLTKPQMFSLIKSGAFDEFGERRDIMKYYVNEISDVKKRVTLQNLQALLTYGLVPDEFDFERRVFNFNKYLKKAKNESFYELDNNAFRFWGANLSMDDLAQSDASESGFRVLQITWDKQYKKIIDRLGQWIKQNSTELLDQLNNCITKEVWDKYCDGSYSKWEMDSVSFYSHPHELEGIDNSKYGFVDFQKLPETPKIERQIPTKDGKLIPLFELSRICGTVLSRDKSKKTVTLLTTSGVVNVKIFGAVFAQYDRRISETGADGKKRIIQGSMFERGNKIAVCGIRDSDSFRAKKYKSTPYHLCEQIDKIDENGCVFFKERITEEG